MLISNDDDDDDDDYHSPLKLVEYEHQYLHTRRANWCCKNNACDLRYLWKCVTEIRPQDRLENVTALLVLMVVQVAAEA